MKKLAVGSLIAITTFLLSGCSMGTAESIAESNAPTPKARYGSVAELKDAFVTAGGECPDFKQTNQVKIAAESADCSSSTVLSTYLSAEATQKRVDESKETFGGSDSSTWLVGENWIINAPNPESLQTRMGGQLISWGDTTELDFYENKFKNILLDDPEGFTSSDLRPALKIGYRICEIYDTDEHQDVLDYLVSLAGNGFTITQLGAILGIATGTLCTEHAGRIPEA